MTRLNIATTEPIASEPVTVTALVRNITGADETYVGNLWVNSQVEATTSVVVPAGGREVVTFQVTLAQGSYDFRVERLTSTLSVGAGVAATPTPTPAPPAPAPTPTATAVPPTSVQPTATAAPPTPVPPTPTPVVEGEDEGISGGVLAGIVVALVVVRGASGFFLYRRRRGG